MVRDTAEVAETQHGLLTFSQARARDHTDDSIWHQLRAGHWEPVAEGVYRVPGSPRTWEQRLHALVLASGPVAAASHRSAAALLGIPGFHRRGIVEVVTPRPRRHRDPQARVHRWRVLPDDHLCVIDGMVTTRVARTPVDLAGVLHPGRTERAVDNYLAMQVVTVADLRTTFEALARRGRKGIAVMRGILDERADAYYVPPGSELESLFLELVRAAGLAEPVRQLDLGDDDWIGRVDFAYPAARLIIELDSRRHHSSTLDRRADHRRDERLGQQGWTVLRITWDDVVHRPEQVVALLRRCLVPTAS